MKDSTKHQDLSAHIKRGNFVDVAGFMRHPEFEIIDITEHKIMLRNVLQDNLRLPVDVSANKIKPFRTISAPTELLSHYHKHYCYWGQGFAWALGVLKSVNASEDLYGGMSAIDIIQFWKGKNYLIGMSMLEKRNIKEDLLPLLDQYAKEFLTFFLRYWQILSIKDLNENNLYESQRKALMHSYIQILINFNTMMLRGSYLDPTMGVLRNFSPDFMTSSDQLMDRVMAYQLDWLRQTFIPYLIHEGNFENLNMEIVIKLLTILIKLTSQRALQLSAELSIALYTKLINAVTAFFPSVTLSRYNEYSKQVYDLFRIFIQDTPQFFQMMRCKLKMTLHLQTLQSGSPLLMNQRNANLVKNMKFVMVCLDYEREELRELVGKYLAHQNGLSLFVKNCNNRDHTNQLIKLLKYCPVEFISETIKARKHDLFRLSNIWTPKLLTTLLELCIKKSETPQKDDLVFYVQVQKIVMGEITALSTKSNAVSMATGRSFEEIEAETNKLIETLSKFQARIILICETVCDSSQKTLTMDYIEKNLVDKYVTVQHANIPKRIEAPETNNFQQNYIFRHYINRLSHFFKEPTQYKAMLFQTFTKLCNGIVALKSKSQLESRKQNLVLILNRMALHYPLEFVDAFCLYARNVGKVQNREFKNRTFQFLNTVLKMNVFKTNEDKVEGYKRMISAMKIENLHHFKIFMELFKFVNDWESNLKLNSVTNINNPGIEVTTPLIIYKRPFGIEKLFQSLIGIYDRFLIKKLIPFFSKIQLKIADEELALQILQQLADNLLDSIMMMIDKYEYLKADQEMICDLVSLLQSLIFHEVPISSMIQSNYTRMFLEMHRSSANSYLGSSNGSMVDSSSGKMARKIKLVIALDNQIHSYEQSSGIESESSQMHVEVETDEKLYSIKARASSFFGISPILSNFYIAGRKFDHFQQNLSMHAVYKLFQNSKKEIKEEEKQKGQAQSAMIQQSEDKQQKKEDQKEQNQKSKLQNNEEDLVMTIKFRPHHNDNVVKQRMMNKLKIVYDCLPFTDKIWAELKIPVELWSIHPKLIEIKKNFLELYPMDAMRTKELSKLSTEEKDSFDQWYSFMEEPLKKKFLFEAFLVDPDLEGANNEWLFNSFTEIRSNSKIGIENNILSIYLIQKLKPRLLEKDLEQMLFKLTMEQKENRTITPKELAEIETMYAFLLNRVFAYIENNANFCIFTYMMKIKHSFYENLRYMWKKYFEELGRLIAGAFLRYLEVNYDQFFNQRMMIYLNESTGNFEFLLSFLDRIPLNMAELPVHKKICEIWLSNSLLLLINNPKYISQLNTNFPVTRTVMHAIWSLLIKGIRCPELYSHQFKIILNMLLYSKLCNTAISIIALLISESAKEGEYYVAYFQKEMNESEWDKKDYIKFNKNNLRHESGFVGLNNPHSICYVNSLLQQLYHIRPFRRELYLTKWKKNDPVEEDLVFQLKKIFINLNFKQCDSYFNRNFFQAFKNDEGSATSIEVQMDVDEFRSILIDRIQNLVMKSENEKNDFVQRIFNGKQLTIIKGKDCDHRSTREEDFSSICLEVKGLKNLGNSLLHYFKPEILNEENKYFCEECNKKVVAEKTNVIKQFPKYLTFVLKRFEYVYQYRKKINERFQFPLENLKMSESKIYRLKGVIVHQGLSEAGHYFSLVKINKKWYEFNDNQITETSEEEIANLSYGEHTFKCNRNAYLLIYEQIEQEEVVNQEENVNQILPYQFGLDEEIANIRKFNGLVWKTDLFLSQEFESFVDTVVKSKVKDSISLLFQYITNIRAKCFKTDFKTVKYFFELLQSHLTSNLINSEQHIDWAIKFYRNQHFSPSLKSAMSGIIASKFETFDENMQKFVSLCLTSLHDQLETSPFYYLLLVLCKADPQVLKFIVSHRIIGRIFDISFPHILLKIQRQNLAKTTQLRFDLIQESKIDKKKSCENNELRYHKWVLINFIVESNIELHRIEQAYLYNWATIKCQQIFDQATHKATINQISKFFTILSFKNQVFSTSYLAEVCEQLSKDKSEHLRKYLKAAFDLLTINDVHRGDRIKAIKKVFSDTFIRLYKERIISSFDVKWQWFIKTVYYNYHFRNYVKACQQQFKLLLSRSQLHSFYQSRNETVSQGRYKNKFYGLKFSVSTSSSTISSLLEQKIEKTKLIFNPETPSHKFLQIYKQEFNYDKNLTDFPELIIKPGSIVWKYIENLSKFKETTVDDSLGDIILINQMYFDRGDEKLTYIRQQGQQMEIECKAESIKIETKMEAEPKENGDEQGANEFGV